MFTVVLGKPLGFGLPMSHRSPILAAGTTHATTRATLSVVILMLIGAAVVLGVVVKGMLENVAAIVGQAIKLFGVLLLMFVVAVVLVAGAVSHASTESPAPSPSTTAPIISSEPRVGS